MKLYFITCPYSDTDHLITEQHFDQCTYAAASLVLSGFAVYSKITMTHPINRVAAQVKKKITWHPIDELFMEKCDELIVLTLSGWERCQLLEKEINFFKSKGRKIWTYDEFAAEHNI